MTLIKKKTSQSPFMLTKVEQLNHEKVPQYEPFLTIFYFENIEKIEDCFFSKRGKEIRNTCTIKE